MTISGILNVNAVTSLFTPKGQDYLALFFIFAIRFIWFFLTCDRNHACNPARK